MNSITPYQYQGHGNPHVHTIGGKITYDGSGVPSIVYGIGFSITDDGTGLITITTSFPWAALVGMGAVRLCASAVGGSVQVAAETPASRTVQLRILNDADAAEDPANGDGFFFSMDFQKEKGVPVK